MKTMNHEELVAKLMATPTEFDNDLARKQEHAERIARLIEEPCEIDIDAFDEVQA